VASCVKQILMQFTTIATYRQRGSTIKS